MAKSHPNRTVAVECHWYHNNQPNHRSNHISLTVATRPAEQFAVSRYCENGQPNPAWVFPLWNMWAIKSHPIESHPSSRTHRVAPIDITPTELSRSSALLLDRLSCGSYANGHANHMPSVLWYGVSIHTVYMVSMSRDMVYQFTRSTWSVCLVI
jgi:hypothetical protein